MTQTRFGPVTLPGFTRRTSTGPFRVTASARVRRLFAELADSIERATYLIGMIDGAEIYLDGGSWSIANGSSRHVSFDLEHRASVLDWCERSGRFQLVGSIHSHPTYHPAGPTPSTTDQRNWRASADDFGRPYCGIIISHGEPSSARLDCDPWRNQMIGCWVAHPDGNDTPIARAHLTIEQDW